MRIDKATRKQIENTPGAVILRTFHHAPVAGPPRSDGARHEIVIDDWTPTSLNVAMRGRLQTRMRVGAEMHAEIGAAAHLCGSPRATGARRVTAYVTFRFGANRPDPDNLAKSMLDALKNVGQLLDDSYELAEWMPPVYRIGDRARTRIVLEEIPLKAVEDTRTAPTTLHMEARR